MKISKNLDNILKQSMAVSLIAEQLDASKSYLREAVERKRAGVSLIGRDQYDALRRRKEQEIADGEKRVQEAVEKLEAFIRSYKA